MSLPPHPQQGKITAQGKLLQQDTFFVGERDEGVPSRPRERRVFLFEQLVIFSEPVDKKKGLPLPGYTFKNSIKVSPPPPPLAMSRLCQLPCCPSGQLPGGGGTPPGAALLPGADLPGDGRQLGSLRHAGAFAGREGRLVPGRGPDLRDPEELPQRWGGGGGKLRLGGRGRAGFVFP